MQVNTRSGMKGVASIIPMWYQTGMRLTDFFQQGLMTRQQFADALGVDPVSVYRWEKGQRLPVRHFARIAAVTENRVTANDFVQPDEAAQ
jgi:transcriptional regulator with XRE-family HTH domain